MVINFVREGALPIAAVVLGALFVRFLQERQPPPCPGFSGKVSCRVTRPYAGKDAHCDFHGAFTVD